MLLCLCGILTWSDNKLLGDCMHHNPSSMIVFKMGPCYQNWCCFNFHNFCCCCSNDSESAPFAFKCVAFSVPVETIVVWNGWFKFSFGLNDPRYHCLLAEIRWQYPLPLVPQDVQIEIWRPPLCH